MANPEILVQSDCFVWFTLSNKPEFECVMDKKDYFELVHNTTSWYIHKSNKGRKDKPYIRRNNGKTKVQEHLHRILLGITGKFTFDEVGDHINGNSLDCRRSNLRNITLAENSRSKGARGESYRNVNINFINSRNRFQAYAGGIYYGSHKQIEQLKIIIDNRIGGVA